MRHFHRRSISRQMFLSILAITGFVLTVFFAVSINLLQQSYTREEAAAIRDNLTKCSRIADLSLEYMEQEARMLAGNAGIISSVVAPDHSRTQRSVSVVNLLGDVVRNSDLISRAVLYVGFDQSVYSSDRAESHVSTDHALMEMVSGYSPTELAEDGRILYMMDGTAFVLQDVPLNGRKRLGTVVLQVNQQELYKIVQDTGDGSYIVVLDQEGNLFLADENIPDQAMSGVQAMAENTEDDPAIYRSDTTGLVFLNWRQGGMPFKGVISRYSILYLIAALLAILGIVYSVFVSRATYRPIRDLVETVSGHDRSGSVQTDGAAAPEGSEIDYLQALFDRTMEDRESLIATTTVLIPEIERRLLCDLVTHQDSAEHVSQYLQDINSRLAQNNMFGVVALKITQEDGVDGPVSSGKQRLARAGKVLAAWSGENAQVYLVPVEDQPDLLLYCTRSDGSAGNNRMADSVAADVKNLLIDLQEEFSGQGERFSAGLGRICTSLRQLPDAYQEAKETLSETFMQAGTVGSGESTGIRIRIHLEKCTQLVLERKDEEAREECRMFCEEIRNEHLPESGRRQAMLTYAGEINRLYRLYGLEEIMLHESVPVSDETLMQEQMTQYGYAYIEVMSDFCKKKSNRQIVSAIRYILGHYQDGMLSLGEVADHIGVKPTYLSTLFVSVTGKRFSDFLKEYRIGAAKELLKNTDMPIGRIGMQCGFNSVQSFNRVFKQVAGRSPGEYRSEKRGRA